MNEESKKNSKWTGLFSVKWRKKKWVNGLGFFSVNGLGLNFCGIFEEKANYRSDFGIKKKKKGNSSEIRVKFENARKTE